MINALHGLWGKNPLHALGSLELFWDFTAPTAVSDTSHYNTVDTSGAYTSFTRAFDFSGKGRHGSVIDKTSAPRLNSGAAQFLGAQQFAHLQLLSVTVGTIFIMVDAGAVTPSSPYNIVGAFSRISGEPAGYLNLGDTTSTSSLETISYTHGGAIGALLMARGDYSGWNTIGITVPGVTSDSLSIITRNGASQVLDHAPTVFAGPINISFLLGRRNVASTDFFTGSIKKVLIYSNRMTASQHQQAYNLLQ